MQKHAILLLTLLVICTGLNISLPEKAIADQCRPLVEQKCSNCHFVTHICPNLKKKKGAWSWKRTVKSMVEHGAELSDTEIKQLVTCLSKPDDDLLDICAQQKSNGQH